MQCLRVTSVPKGIVSTRSCSRAAAARLRPGMPQAGSRFLFLLFPFAGNSLRAAAGLASFAVSFPPSTVRCSG